MDKQMVRWQWAGLIFVEILGPILHFLFDWTNQNRIIGAISAVNESTWEHMKILFIPMFIFAVVESIFIKRDDFWCVKLTGIATGLLLIPILFYTLNGVFGKTPDFVNILIYYVAVISAFLVEWRMFKGNNCKCPKRVATSILLAIFVLFVVWTYLPPEIPIFRDPISGGFGI